MHGFPWFSDGGNDVTVDKDGRDVSKDGKDTGALSLEKKQQKLE